MGAALCWVLLEQVGGIVFRRLAIEQIGELTGAKVDIKSADFKLPGSLTLKEVAIRLGKEAQYGNVPFKAERIAVKFSLGSIFALRPRLKKVAIKDFFLNTVYDSQGRRWNIGGLNLKRTAKSGAKLPILQARGGTIRFGIVSDGRISEIVSLPIKSGFGAVKDAGEAYSFYVRSADDSPQGVSQIKGLWHSGRQGSIRLEGRICTESAAAPGSGWTIDDLAVELKYDENEIVINRLDFQIGAKTLVRLAGAVKNYPTHPEYDVGLKVRDLLLASEQTPNAFVYNERVLKNFSPFVQNFFVRFNPQGQADVDIKALWQSGRAASGSFTGQINCKDVSFRYEKFPYLVEHLTGTIDFANKDFVLNRLCGRHNDVELAIKGYSKDSGADWDYRVEVTSDNMLLDDELYAALGTRLKRLWFVFAPSGRARVDYCWVRQPKAGKKSSLQVELAGASAACQYFPYPLKNLTGTMFIDRRRVVFRDIVSRYDGREIVLSGEITGIDRPRPEFNVLVNAVNIPVDSTLRAALPDRQRKFLRHFEVDGLTNVQMTIFSTTGRARPAEYAAEVELKAKTIIYDKMPLALTDASVRAVLTGDAAQLESLAGRCGGGKVLLSSEMWSAKQGGYGSGYRVSLQAEGIELNEFLTAVLPEKAGKILAQLQGQGRINLTLELSKEDDAREADYIIAVDCLGNSANFEKLSYPLMDIKGRVTITNKAVFLKDITAAVADGIHIGPDAATVKVNGDIRLGTDGFDGAELGLSARNVPFDERFGILADAIWPGFYEGVRPAGRFDLNAESIRIIKGNDADRWVDFAGSVAFKDCGFGREQVLEQLSAILQVEGRYEAGTGLSRGRAKLRGGALKLKGKRVNNLQGAAEYNLNKKTWSSRDFVADCYGGRVTGSIELAQLAGADWSYNAEVCLDDVDLYEFMAAGRSKESAGSGYSNGLLSGWASVSGRLGDEAGRTGRMKLAVDEMRVGRLSPLAKLIAALKLKSSKDCAFERMRVDSYIRGNELLLECVDLLGEAVCMRGSGRMGLANKQVELDFTASGEGLRPRPSLLESLAIGLSPAFVQMEVRGDFDNPQVKTTTLPVIKDSLGILGTKRQRR